MTGAHKRIRELEALGAKVYEATKLVGQLRESNRALASQLEAIKRRLDTNELEGTAAPSSGAENVEAQSPVPATDRELEAEVKRLRRERLEIRRRVSNLLEQLDSLGI